MCNLIYDYSAVPVFHAQRSRYHVNTIMAIQLVCNLISDSCYIIMACRSPPCVSLPLGTFARALEFSTLWEDDETGSHRWGLAFWLQQEAACKQFPPWTKSFSPPLTGFSRVYLSGSPHGGVTLVLLPAGCDWPECNATNNGVHVITSICFFLSAFFCLHSNTIILKV